MAVLQSFKGNKPCAEDERRNVEIQVAGASIGAPVILVILAAVVVIALFRR